MKTNNTYIIEYQNHGAKYIMNMQKDTSYLCHYNSLLRPKNGKKCIFYYKTACNINRSVLSKSGLKTNSTTLRTDSYFSIKLKIN